MAYKKDPRVDDYINSLPRWQQNVCKQVRNIVHAADPEVVETIKRTNRPYFELQGNICALFAVKSHVNIFIYDPITPDPKGIINQGQGNLTARSIQVYEDENIDGEALLNLLEGVIKNNKAGGWRKLQSNK